MTNHFVLNPDSLGIFIKLSVAMICGVILGAERIMSHKSAGMRTYALVSMSSALFIIIADMAVKVYATAGLTGFDPFHFSAAIVSGVGFMCAGVIIFKDTSVKGLTTASGLWAAAGIGMACGYGFFVPAVMMTLLAIFVFIVLWHVEKFVKKFSFAEEKETDSN